MAYVVLYRLSNLLEAVACEQPIFIAEGEKDVLARSYGSASLQRATTAAPANGATSIPNRLKTPTS